MADTGALNIYQGDNYYAFVIVLNADGTAADLAGYTAYAQIRVNVADTANTIQADLNPTITDNLITMHLDPTTTTALNGNYLWDVEIHKAGAITTLMRGPVNVTQEVTRLVGV